MSERPENPFAFPSPDDGRPSDGYGMTLRDYFAAHAHVEAYAPAASYELAYGRPPNLTELADYIAIIRHLEADAMLAERSKP